MNKFLNFKAGIITSIAALILGGIVASSAGVNAAVNHPNPTPFHIIVDGGAVKDLTVEGMNENLSSTGFYSVTYRFTYPSRDGEIRFPLQGMLHRCDEGNGMTSGGSEGVCVDPSVYTDNRQVALDSSNNYSQDITF